MKEIKSLVVSLIIIVAIVIGIIWLLNHAPAGMHGDIITIRPGMNLHQTAYYLKSKNVITSASFFIVMGRLLNETNVIAGNYRIYEGENSFSILHKITRGRFITKKVTIPEGFTMYDIARLLDSNDICSEGNFLYYAQSPAFMTSVGIPAPGAEGYLFPDTYLLPENSDPRDVIIRLVNQTKKVITEIKNSVDGKNVSVHDMLVIASLVEREAKINSERPLIAAVFYNRLRLKMRLDCDSTVQYGLKKFGKKLTYNDLNEDTPYNTYKFAGLPPTPICNPGKQSILAAYNPADVAYLFFVARNDGSHYFSKTLQEHSRAVDYYQKGIKNGFIDRQKH
ncbi:MAG TPA: endolytic transglycosylase MltG [Spirochaetota bacterium]|nr:endolytic transglycosylase MltG [Spirochaetota bacterium]HOT20939.1 endolytic transglycosylase MltG [Spirochaetota bacterium]HPD04656.1 endolytic transglycosylase MltG [Spirochaetota bacterium]HQG43802.1 endolytic transglycosylase MltG [Spirochaetota bacterium]HQI37475.1 endolytic transglycosylase MltG [Spirochaetota bacterium]